MEKNEAKRANDLKEIEIKLNIWKELFTLGEVEKSEYVKVQMYAFDMIKKAGE